MLDEPPVNDKLHVEVQSSSSRIGLIHPKVLLHHCLHDIGIRNRCCPESGLVS